MLQLLIATNNRGKIHEYQDLLKGIPFELVTPGALGINMEVEETGLDFSENALLKATTFAKASGLLTLADDSGLEVDALNGEPGVRSHRYAGEGATDADRVNYLLNKMKGIPREKRTAHFRCVIAIAHPEGKVEFYEGRCDGLIAFVPRGQAGFGYDPVFYFPELDKTMAELPLDTKNRISHRARAAQKAVEKINRL
jgi:XTP/dITP diphosphohydrolase